MIDYHFLKFYPGLVGGHCIGVDPYYLKYKSIKIGVNPKIISAGRYLNDSMVSYVFNIIKKKIGGKRKKLLFLGATFKEDCNDMRNSKNLEVIKKFIKTKKYNIDFYDPFLQNNKYDRYFGKHFKKLKNLKKNYFAVIILVPHAQIIRRQTFFLNKINDGGYLFDLKGIVDKKNIKKEFNYWSL
jgi:UDP-N-acetyl-D-galactosamine dehydrogenase